MNEVSTHTHSLTQIVCLLAELYDFITMNAELSNNEDYLFQCL